MTVPNPEHPPNPVTSAVNLSDHDAQLRIGPFSSPDPSLRNLGDAPLRQQPEDLDHLSLEDCKRLLCELRVQQSELQGQNEALRDALKELAAAHDGYLTDILERKRAEEEVAAHVTLLQTILGAVKDGITFSDDDGYFLVFNAEMERLTGYTIDEANASGDFTTLLYPDPSHRRRAIEELATLHTTRQANQIETSIITKQGRRLVLLVSSCVVLFEGRQMFLTAYHDITERKRVEEILQESHARFQTIFHSTADGMFVLNFINERFYLANRACLHMLGYTAMEFRDLGLPDLHLAEDLPFIRDLIAQCHDQSTSRRADIQFKRKDGSLFFADLTPTPMTFAGQDFVLMVIRDITLHKEAEAQRNAYQEELRALMAQITSVEQETRQHIAMELHDQIGQMLAFAKIQLDALDARTTDVEAKSALQKIGGNIQHSLHSVRSLSSELCPPLLVESGLGDAVRWLAEEMREQFQLVISVNETVTLPPIAPPLSGMLYWIVRELLLNVVKHAHAQSVTVSLELVEQCLHIHVDDDGCGFTPESLNIPHDVEHGFGLFSIHERLRYLGGQMQIISAPGQGTHITIIMPLA